MKRIFFVVMFFCLTLSALSDDCGYCLPTDPWISGTMIRDFGPCQLIIEYEWRECFNPVKRDLKLKRVALAGTCYLTPDLAVEYGTRYLLNSVFEIFPSLNNLDSGDVHFSTQCCWEGGSTSTGGGATGGNGYDYFEPCSSFVCCCESDYTVEKVVQFGSELYRYISSKSQSDDGSGTFCSGGCEKVCDTFNDIETGTALPPISSVPCIDTCGNIWYNSGANVVNKSYGSLCNIEIYYQYRECAGFVEVKFHSVHYDGNDCGNIDDILKESIEGVLAQVATHFTLPKVVRLKLPTCWNLDQIDGYKFARVCDYLDDCCKVEYTLVSDGFTGAKVEQYSTDINAAYTICNVYNPCIFICDSDHLGITENQTLSKLAAQNIEGNLFETSSLVIPNPTNENIDIEINSRYNGKMTISITDLNGKVMITQEVNKTNDIIIAKIITKELAKGVYFYKIKAGLHEINGGQFVKE